MRDREIDLLFYFFFGMSYGKRDLSLVPQLGNEPLPPAVEV